MTVYYPYILPIPVPPPLPTLGDFEIMRDPVKTYPVAPSPAPSMVPVDPSAPGSTPSGVSREAVTELFAKGMPAGVGLPPAGVSIPGAAPTYDPSAPIPSGIPYEGWGYTPPGSPYGEPAYPAGYPYGYPAPYGPTPYAPAPSPVYEEDKTGMWILGALGALAALLLLGGKKGTRKNGTRRRRMTRTGYRPPSQ